MAITYTDNGGGAPNGSDKEFTYTFPVLQNEDVKVALNAVVQATTKYTVDTASNPTKITFNNTSIDSNVQESTGAPKTGVTVRVFRETQVGKSTGDDDPKAVYAAGSSIRAVDLNANTEQALYAIHELQDQPITDQDIEDGAITSDKIQDGTIVNADINAAAAIAGTKIAPDFGSQNIATTGTVNNVTTTELSILDGATVSTAELNTLDGITASTAELNKLDGVTASTAELNLLDGVTATTAEINKLDGVTATTAELNLLDGVTATTTELNLIDGVTATTAELNYVDGVTSNIQTQINSLSSNKQPLDAELTELATMASGTASALADLNSGEVQILDGATVSTSELNKLDGVTASTAELNLLDGVTSTTAELNLLDGITASTSEINKLDGVTASTAELNLLDGVTATTTELNLNDGQTATPAEVNILDGATLNTNELNKLDGVTASTTELNLLAGKSIVTSIASNATDVQIPSAQAVNERVVELVTEVGGFHPIANETSFPATNPDINDGAGTIVSLKALSSSFSTGSGVTTHTFTNGAGTGNNVTINGLPANTTFQAGKGLLLETTTTLHTYTYHRLVLDESGVSNADALVTNFNERYYGPFSANQATRPSGANRQNGDLYFNTSDGKMKVWNGSHASGTWDDVAAPGNFFINTLSSSSGANGGSATFNNTAKRFTLSNPPTSAQQLLVSVNGVVQKPNSGTSPSEGFAIDGSDIIFASAPATNAPFFIVTIGSSVNIGTPSDNTVTSAKIVDGSIVNGDISSSAAIAGTKISPDFGSQNIATTGNASVGETVTLTGNNPNITFTDSNSNPDFKIYGSNGSFSILDSTNGANRFVITNAGNITIGGNLDVNSGLDVTGTITATDHVSINADSKMFRAGASNDIRMHHDSNDSYFDSVTGNLYLYNHASAKSIIFGTEGANKWKIMDSGHYIPNADSSFDIGTNTVRVRNGYFDTLYGDGSNLTGLNTDLVSDTTPQLGGNLQTNGNNIQVADNDNLNFGNSSDLYIKHSSGHNANFIVSYQGDIEHHMTSSKKIIKGFQNSGTPYVALYQDGNERLRTTGDGVILNAASDISHSSADNLQVGTGSGSNGITIYSGSSDNGSFYFADGSSGNQAYRGFIEYSHSSDALNFGSGGATAAYFDSSGHFLPSSNNAKDLGSTSKRWRNIYTNDLHLSNEGSSNDVDSTWGDWTIQEGESDLFLKNNRSGKKYKFNLTEVS